MSDLGTNLFCIGLRTRQGELIGIGTEVKENERESSVPWVVCAWISRTIFFHGE